ncbi:MAG: DUF3311 domain-containing protein [Ornithinibacter sp.]
MHDVRTRPSRGPWLLVLALLLPAVVVPLLVPLYDREDPAFLGFPFFFWFQFALILGAVVLTGSAFVVARAVDRRDRVAHGLPADPDGTGADRETGGVR